MEEQVKTLTDTINEIILDIKSIVEEHGEQGVELVGFVLQMEAIYNILWPILCLVLGFICIPFLFGCIKTANKEWAGYRQASHKSIEESQHETKHIIAVIKSFISGASGGIFLIVGFVGIITGTIKPILWLAAFDPYVALATKALGYL